MKTNQKLQKLLTGKLVPVPANITAYFRPLRDICTKNRLSFESQLAISDSVLDYRILASECWVMMQTRMMIVGSSEAIYSIKYNLMLLALKFTRYFTEKDLVELLKIFPHKLSVENQFELDQNKLHSYLHNYLSFSGSHTSVDPDILGYYSAEATAIRSSGVISKLVETSGLFFEVQEACVA